MSVPAAIRARVGARRDRNAGLDPATDHHEIVRNLALYEFPWDINQSLSFALFRTYAVPSIGDLLDRTGEFTDRVQKRYDDTALLLEVPLVEGFDSPAGRSALRRINNMHRMYDISNDDFRYVLATFVVVPKRWIDDYGWRRLTEAEVEATVRYYTELGRHMGIKDIPRTFDDFARFMDDYEREHFRFSPGARRVADATLALMTTFYPKPAARIVDAFSRAIMDDPLLDAFEFRRPSPTFRSLSRAALKARARIVAVLPARRRPSYVRDWKRIRSYPTGFRIDALGTFAPGCPVPSAARTDEGARTDDAARCPVPHADSAPGALSESR